MWVLAHSLSSTVVCTSCFSYTPPTPPVQKGPRCARSLPGMLFLSFGEGGVGSRRCCLGLAPSPAFPTDRSQWSVSTCQNSLWACYPSCWTV